ncbi:negative regulator of flagellin synthesis FlgM [Scopulibacillus daqui]|uniref:Negative regulator of flagellin synthesis n=1 Tax=Scopulibacillus daqui TaxID=1469162 RepID=A0ABS2PZ92_9BACL|nr:flagellar biosynthesis anti-sigma factor FlgM [Scopulibacillus daqui]MBM7645040.1 negative regulator of flagellin synthesis FlgM [Scopulibacillus daqui]
MKIDAYHGIQKYQSYQKQSERNKELFKKTPEQDQVEISSKAKQLQKTSDFEAQRKEKIARLKAEIDNGTYKIKPEEIAKKLYDFWNR